MYRFLLRELAAFYAVAALFGFIYAGVMPLCAVLARKFSRLRMKGAVTGGITMTDGLSMTTGLVPAGVTFGAFGGYAWLLIGSFALGIEACLIAPLFRPVERSRGDVTRSARQRARRRQMSGWSRLRSIFIVAARPQ